MTTAVLAVVMTLRARLTLVVDPLIGLWGIVRELDALIVRRGRLVMIVSDGRFRANA